MDLTDIVYRDKYEELYALLNHYELSYVENAVYQMFLRASTPLCNHWDSIDNFATVYFLFLSLARKLPAKDFVHTLLRSKIPEGITLNREERMILSDVHRLKTQARFLHDFMLSLKDYFDYEVILMEKGYPVPNVA